MRKSKLGLVCVAIGLTLLLSGCFETPVPTKGLDSIRSTLKLDALGHVEWDAKYWSGSPGGAYSGEPEESMYINTNKLSTLVARLRATGFKEDKNWVSNPNLPEGGSMRPDGHWTRQLGTFKVTKDANGNYHDNHGSYDLQLVVVRQFVAGQGFFRYSNGTGGSEWKADNSGLLIGFTNDG